MNNKINSKKINGFTYYLSNRKNKLLKVFVNNKWVHFGSHMQHYYDKTKLSDPRLNHFDKERKQRYLKRSMMIRNKKNEYTYNNIDSPNYHSIRILW